MTKHAHQARTMAMSDRKTRRFQEKVSLPLTERNDRDKAPCCSPLRKTPDFSRIAVQTFPKFSSAVKYALTLCMHPSFGTHKMRNVEVTLLFPSCLSVANDLVFNSEKKMR